MQTKFIVLFLLIFLFSLKPASAQLTQETKDLVNSIVVPSLVVLILIFGVLSFLKIPRIFAGLVSLGSVAFLYYIGIIHLLTSNLTSLGGVISTFVFIGLFFLGVLLASKAKPVETKTYANPGKGMQRKQITTGITQLEKQIVDVENKINKLKTQENNLELMFSTNKDNKLVKELERVRKMRNDMTDLMEKLLDQREKFKKVYREVSS